ncbi:P-loop containing nucleoside triphosphate hydrolase protein [Gymnopilus junonius]|uniref:P-loop containing nucleoside triphosphate hydrolase protein n=1 Tax=Gymnopilus junonius TaxID=109634 RepID=A0A9P5P3J6_GYMJU|nr:P-loop containing nucleoside triphosphate hydrolase protein [Gymnopilus junonius]
MASINEADEFVNVFLDQDSEEPVQGVRKDAKDFYAQWVEQSSAKMAIPAVTGAEALRRLYPNHSLVLTQGRGMSILGFPGASVTPVETSTLVTNLVFIPLARSLGTVPGVLVDSVQYGAFKVTWKQFEYLIYSISHPSGFGTTSQYFILHEGPEEVSRLYLLASGTWSNAIHEEIWVFNQGFWQKDHGLWVEVQKADWKDVILKDEFKKALQKDVYGFFSSKSVYKELGIPWKRGLIMHGPPGNGKTISLKTIMKTCGEKGFAPLYVKSFQSYMGEEGAMATVFDKARQLAPCVIILEDLDSLINDRNRSFFLNQLDGLEGNDGLLIIGTTNHFDRLDPGLSTRPSRFDRKYYFGDPDESERRLYALYWQQKLAPNKDIEFPDQLVIKVAESTDKFSFAYLKEAFVSSLVTFAGIDGKKPTFESVLVAEIETLRKQLDKLLFSPGFAIPNGGRSDTFTWDVRTHHHRHSRTPSQPSPSDDNHERIRALLDALSEKVPRVPGRIYQGSRDHQRPSQSDARNNRDVRVLLDALSDSLASLDLPSVMVVTKGETSVTF